MQVMQAFDVRWEATAILLADFDLVRPQSHLFSFVLGYDHASIYSASQLSPVQTGITYNSHQAPPMLRQPPDSLVVDICFDVRSFR